MVIHIFIDSKSIEIDVIQIQSRSMSDPILFDIDFQKWNGLGSELPLNAYIQPFLNAYLIQFPFFNTFQNLYRKYFLKHSDYLNDKLIAYPQT